MVTIHHASIGYLGYHSRCRPHTCSCAQSSEEYGGVAWTLGAEGELNTVFDHPAYRDDMEIQV